MRADQVEYIIFDVETTGFYPKDGDRIIEIAAVKMKNGQVVDTFESLINPERDLPLAAQNINKITPDMIVDAPTAEKVLPKMVDFIGGGCLVAHNIKFDMDFLCYQLAVCGRRLNEATPGIDTLKMARKFIPHLTSHKLTSLAHFFGIPINDAHRAMADTHVTMLVLKFLLDMAKAQEITQFSQVLSHFGVAKPSFQIEPVSQGLLF